MTPQDKVTYIRELAELISLEDNTIEDSPDTDSLLLSFEKGEL